MSSPRWLSVIAVVALGLGACDSKITSAIDTDLQAKINTLNDCFPNLYQWADKLIEIADTWKPTNGGSTPDPAGLVTVINGDGSITATLPVGATTITMDINFYGPGGARQDLTAVITPPVTLGDKIDAAATELRDLFGTAEKHIHGVWSISGGGITATGEALNGEIGGSLNQNELEVLRTTLVPVTTGIPDNDPSTITDGGPPICIFQFNIPALFTDEEPGQEYPRGDVAVTVTGPEATVNATISFNKTAIATITVEGAGATFSFNLETRDLTVNP